MTSIPFWRRYVSVSVAGLVITEPKIEFSLRRKVSGEPPSGSLLIHNLAPNTQQRIEERGEEILVEAGYSNFHASIFTGATQKVERDRINLSGITRITITGKSQMLVHPPTTTGSWVQASLHAIIAQYVADLGLNLGSLDSIPDEIIDHYEAGPSGAGLTRLLESRGFSWYEENGFARFNRPAAMQTGAGTITLNPQSGLIGRPTRTDAGGRCRALLLPQVQLGTQIQLESLSLSGNWKVVGLEHKGTNWPPGDFFTDMELREL